MATGQSKTQAPRREVTLTRIFDAPLDLVWTAWTDPQLLAKWWGPHHFTNPVCEVNLRPGGKLRIDMRAPDGVVYPMIGTFHEIVPASRLVFVAVAQDHDGNALLESRTTVTFEDQGEKTRITVHASAVGIAPIAGEMLKGMEPGWAQSLDRLAVLVSGG
jgi:uncharacterized protein YndB with AHSA1/START domain